MCFTYCYSLLKQLALLATLRCFLKSIFIFAWLIKLKPSRYILLKVNGRYIHTCVSLSAMATSPQRQRLQNVLQLPGYPPNNGPLINDRELQIQTPLFIANVSKLVHTARRCSLFLFCSASFPGSLSSASLGRWKKDPDTNISTGVESTNDFCRSQLNCKKGRRWPHSYGQIHLWNSPVLLQASHRRDEIYLSIFSTLKYHCDFNSRRSIC